jgi:HK97 family phage portal protein
MAWPFSRKIEIKENPIGASLLMQGGQAWSKPQNARAYIEEGYQLNVIVYRAVTELTRAVADIAVEVVSASGEVFDTHPALDLMKRPNPVQGFDTWIKDAFTNFLLLGEMGMVRYPEGGKPIEIWNVSPLHVKVNPGRGGMPSGYEYDQNGAKRVFPVEYPSGRSQFFFHKMINPIDYWRGQSPLVAAGLAADTHNAGLRWNYSLLRNSARPSGLIKLPEGAGGEVVARLKEWFKSAFQGERSAGEIPVLPGGADWVPMDNSPRDMDFLSTQKEAAKLIALAYGIPLPLVDNEASTYNNMSEAKERFYTETVLPMFREFLSQFGAWVLPYYGEGLSFQINEDRVGALEGVRTRLFERMLKAVQAGVLTVDEARTAIGYDPRGGASDELDPFAGVVLPTDPAQAKRLGYGD